MKARFVKRVCLGAALGALIVAHAPHSSHAQEAATVDTLYADLVKLPPAERSAQILDGAKKEGHLSLVSTLRGDLTRDELRMFRARYPFLDVDMSESGSQDAAERLLSEEVAGRHLTDLVELSIADMRDLLARNMVAHYQTPATAAILPQNKAALDATNRWTPFSVSEFGIVYNSDLLPPGEAPRSWDDLCDPKYKGQISFDPPEIRFLYGLYVMMGDAKFQQWLACIGANKPIIQRGHAERLQLMLAGDHIVSPDQYFYLGVSLKRADPKVPFGMVTSAPILTSYLSDVINKNALHPYAAALLADWHLSDEFQDYLAAVPRGPITRPSSYVPLGSPLVIYSFGTDEEYNRIRGYWKRYIPQ